MIASAFPKAIALVRVSQVWFFLRVLCVLCVLRGEAFVQYSLTVLT
jgi:hypothetical protein